jgi:hypothetical protein
MALRAETGGGFLAAAMCFGGRGGQLQSVGAGELAAAFNRCSPR